MRFYNPRMSVITFGISILNCTVQISMAKALDSNFSGRPQTGQRVYDWENNTQHYSITPEECFSIFESIEPLLRGTYINRNTKDKQYEKTFSITHFRDNQPSLLLLNQTKDQNNNPTGSIIMTLIPPKSAGQAVSYPFRRGELVLFREFVKHGFSSLPFEVAKWEGIGKAEWKRAEDRKKKQNGGVNSGTYTQPEQPASGYDSQYGGYQPQETTFDNPPAQTIPQPVPNSAPVVAPAPASDVSQQDGAVTKKVDELSFDW